MIRVWIIILILIKCSGCAQIWESAEKVSEEIHGGRDLSTLIIQNLRSQEKYKCDDISHLSDILTVEYNLEELEGFLGESSTYAVLYGGQERLTFDRVNERFPIEVTRSEGPYSVYKVRPDGYCFVFWLVAFDSNGGFGGLEVDYVLFYEGPVEIKRFSGLIPGVSTVSDVRTVDPYLEMSELSSGRVCSFSLLNEEEVLMISYVEREDGERRNLIVDEITIMQRARSMSDLRLILPEDLVVK